MLHLFSGGKESLLSLHRLHKKDIYPKLLYFDYGCPATSKEVGSLIYYAKKYSCGFDIIDLKRVISVPNNFSKRSGISLDLPMRNTVFLSIALHIAITEGHKSICFPYTSSEGMGITDSTTEFVEKFMEAYHIQDYRPVRVEVFSNIKNLRSDRTIHYLLKEVEDLTNLWHCLSDSEDGSYCGKCTKCTAILNEKPMTRKIKEFIKLRYAHVQV